MITILAPLNTFSHQGGILPQVDIRLQMNFQILRELGMDNLIFLYSLKGQE